MSCLEFWPLQPIRSILLQGSPHAIEMNETQKEPEFRDYYYTLGIGLDATREVVEQTYWQHIRASRLDESEAPARPRDIEDLNEAYRVLITPKLRSSFNTKRAEVLGPSAAPRAPQPERLEPPLRVMETQIPTLRKQADTASQVAAETWSLPFSVRVIAGSVTVLATATSLAIRWLLF